MRSTPTCTNNSGGRNSSQKGQGGGCIPPRGPISWQPSTQSKLNTNTKPSFKLLEVIPQSPPTINKALINALYLKEVQKKRNLPTQQQYRQPQHHCPHIPPTSFIHPHSTLHQEAVSSPITHIHFKENHIHIFPTLKQSLYGLSLVSESLCKNQNESHSKENA